MLWLVLGIYGIRLFYVTLVGEPLQILSVRVNGKCAISRREFLIIRPGYLDTLRPINNDV